MKIKFIFIGAKLTYKKDANIIDIESKQGEEQTWLQ